MATNEASQERLTLLVESETTHDPTIPVRWCITQQLVKKLAEQGAEDTHILIITYDPETRYEHRYLVPLTNVMAYVQFHNHGPQKIFATILWGKSSITKRWRKRFLRRQNNSYVTDVIDHDSHELYDSEYSAELTVNVDGALFAKKPWDRKFVMMFHDEGEGIVDECQFRKYRFIAYPCHPPLIALVGVMYAVIVLAAAISASFLFLFGRKFNLKAVFTFMNDGNHWNDIWYDCGYYFNKGILPLFRPGYLAVIGLATWAIIQFAPVRELAFGFVVSAIICAGGYWVVRYAKKRSKVRGAHQLQKTPKKPQPEVIAKSFNILLCDHLKNGEPITAISLKSITLRLGIMWAKAKVCKPFPRS